MGGMRRAWVGLGIAGAVALAVALAWPDDAPPPPIPGPQPTGDHARAPPTLEEEYPEPPPARPAQALGFRVVGPEGPIAGATVSLFLKSGPSHHGRWLPSARGETGADGTVALSAAIADDDEPWLSVSAPYFAGDELAFDGGTVRLKALPLARGWVLRPNRSPAASARVSTDNEPLMDTSTDERGRFSFRIPWPGALLVEVDSLSATFTGYTSPASMEQEVEIVLTESPKAEGRVVGRNGAGLPKVEVEVKAGALTKYFVTGADGAWVGTLFAGGRAYLTYTKQGYLPFSESELELTRREEPVVLSRPSKIVGTLVTNDGLAVADAGVMLQPSFTSTMTDAKGKFTFDDVEQPEVVLEAEVDGVTAAKTVAVPEGQTVTVKLMAPPALTDVPLLVVDLEGEVPPAWKAAAVPIPARGWESHASSFRGQGDIGLLQGRFRIDVVDEEHALSGGVTLDVDPKDAKPIRILVTGPDGGLGKRLETDRRPVVRVKVRVVSANGALVRDATVGCSGGPRPMVKLDRRPRQPGGRVDGAALPVAEGVWGCPIYPDDDGAVEVRVDTPDGAKGVAHVTVSDKEVTVTVRAAKTVRGKVVGVLPPGTQLRVFSAMGTTVVPLYSNDFVVPDQPAVRTIVRAYADEGVSPLGCAVSVDEAPVEVPIGPMVAVSFVAKDAAGAPITTPIVYLDRGNASQESADGRTTLHVAPGTHVLVLNVYGSKVRAELVFTTKGPTTDLGILTLK
jgi:hypothetical protein